MTIQNMVQFIDKKEMQSGILKGFESTLKAVKCYSKQILEVAYAANAEEFENKLISTMINMTRPIRWHTRESYASLVIHH